MTRTGAALLAAISLLAGCQGFDDQSMRRTGGGAAVGAASGAIIGAMTGSAGTGAAVGAVAGATGGYLYDQMKKDQY